MNGDRQLLAVSDLHVAYGENRDVVRRLHPGNEGDWLIVAGDVSETFAEIAWALGTLRDRFAQVIWAPGNHELWTPRDDPQQARGMARYRMLVDLCRRLGVLTPEDPFPIWDGPGGPAVVAPLFVLYDYSFRRPGLASKHESLAEAYESGVVCSDELLLHTDPYLAVDDWCRERVAETERRLEACDPGLPTVLVNHYPLVRTPTDVLHHLEFAQWCGTEHTAGWHRRFHAAAMVYGHLHVPRTTVHDGVRFEEVSLGYPREWRRHTTEPHPVRGILTGAPALR
jgi:3',5'-cyclic AMP phosphodiesterase CpdA